MPEVALESKGIVNKAKTDRYERILISLLSLSFSLFLTNQAKLIVIQYRKWFAKLAQTIGRPFRLIS
jgi:hypothetical protein